MALPHLIKYIYNNGTDEVIRRGRKIHSTGNIELIEYDELLGSVVLRIKDDSYATYYKVYITKFKDPKNLSIRCSCPYNLGDICKHEVAALFQLQEMLDKNMLGKKALTYNQTHTIIKMKQLELKLIKLLCSQEAMINAENYLRNNRAVIVEAKDERVCADVEYNDQDFKVVIQKNEERNFDTSCNCEDDHHHPLCVHKTIVLLQLINSYGVNYFDSIRNWDKEKNKLLALYGYSLDDDIQGKFEFTYQNGKPFLRVLDPSIKRTGTAIPNISQIPQVKDMPREDKTPESDVAKPLLKLGIVVYETDFQYPYLQLDAIQGEVNDAGDEFLGRVEKVDLAKFIDTEAFSDDDKLLIQQLRKLLPGEISRYLNRNSPFSGIWENIVQLNNTELPEETRLLVMEYLHPKYKKIFEELAGSHFVFSLPKHKSFQTANLGKANLADSFISPEFTVDYVNGNYELSCYVSLADERVSITDNQLEASLLFYKGSTVYCWARPEDIILAEKFLPEGKWTMDSNAWQEKLQSFILPLSREYTVHFNNIQKETITDVKPEVRILLKEKGEYLLFQPIFTYKGYDVKTADKDNIILPNEDKLLLIKRNYDFESSVNQRIESLHSSFIKTGDDHALALRGSDVLKNNWFFLFVDAIKEMNIPMYGSESLRHFRFNTAKPSTKIYISSNTDWFDAKVDIFFGEQKISVADIKHALANKQQYVHLQDGTLGVLPEEWIKKYSLLFRIGEGKDNHVKLNKFHFSVIEDLYSQRDEDELTFQLEEKYQRLKGFESIAQIEPPLHLQSTLRPYQVSGFQWLNYLNEVRWGGILADDMGLGKTIQALSFLHHISHTKGKLKALVVCPTTLIYNWENEIKKFTPSISYSIHHGILRSKNVLNDDSHSIIITTYGTLRSDIKQFVEVDFDYVVLDESQAIKNPASKVAKATSLLKAKNRLCMSGTPLQNNTFDIYAQMNFLNPGMLGSIEFFKQEFAIPIDKYGEQEQKEHLRKLLYPFILRRTKEQVAKDLPEKTEMVLYCEMDEEQRNIYDAYRNDFRDKILGLVDTQGIQKSQLTILQGLMRLRQICDSPAILKDESYPNASVKLNELERELSENIGNHKTLIFSQFLGMLSLIKDKLHKAGIEYEYFDGSTSATDREKAIRHFQSDERCRVFLISLKAGGVGLNLTAADYVYIVDPWWNPAVEQQAIDRTHRIGQTKNIFAYRMICKDTVEDKIMTLQEKKRTLAADLIKDDTGFVKSLTRNDIEYLFS